MMTASMSRLLKDLSRNHYPYPPAAPAEIEAFEQRLGWRLDPELREFYLHCNGAELFERRPDTPYRFLQLAEIRRARVAIFGEDEDKWGPASMYVICDVQDGDYIIVDVSQQGNGRYPIIDGYHEAFPDPEYCRQISSSFSGFLERALRSNGRHFYLQTGKR